MIERPILFSAPMVRAILEGRKTQTRRVVKMNDQDIKTLVEKAPNKAACCPYGQPGHRLWVRETFWESKDKLDVLFRADGAVLGCGRWRPSIHMPRRLSRILLEINSVDIDRLQFISDREAQAEGVKLPPRTVTFYDGIYSNEFRLLWEQINGAGSWQLNPWVWVIDFRRVLP